MAVLPMKKVLILGLKKDKAEVLERLQRLETFEVDDLIEDEESEGLEAENFSKLIAEKSELKKKAQGSVSLIELYSGKNAPKGSFFDGRKILSGMDYNKFKKESFDNCADLANQTVKLDSVIRQAKADINQNNLRIEALTPWKDLTLPLDFEGTEHTKFFIGMLSGKLEKSDAENLIMETLAKTELNEDVSRIPFEIEIVSASEMATYMLIVCHVKHENLIREALRQMSFVYPQLKTKLAPGEQIEELKNSNKELESQIEQDSRKIGLCYDKIPELQLFSDYLTMSEDRLKAGSLIKGSQGTFFLTGYIAAPDYESMAEAIGNDYIVHIESEDMPRADEVPVKLRNNTMVEPLEGTIGSYSLPGKNDVDPTFAVSIFYYFFFGMMFSDAGYGLVMMIVCAYGLLKHKSKLERSLKNSLIMFFFAGVFTTFWGAMFGSFFGDLIGVASQTFSDGSVSFAPVWFDAVTDPMRLLKFSMIFGMVHLFTGLGIKGYEAIKQKDYTTFVVDVLSWYVLLFSVLIVLVDSAMIEDIFKYSIDVPQGVLTACKYLAIASSVVIVIMSARDIQNKAGRIGMGVYNLYGITGWLSDVLSYARLLALGLATGVIGSVVNKMAGMVAAAAGPVGIIFFILIVVVGHAMNFGINVLGAYVHTNRLQYVEFFGKFYDGGGIKFEPLKMNTKYYKFMED